MATGQPFRTENYPEDPRITKDYLAATLAESIVAELAVPIQTEGQLQGILFVDNRSPRPFTEQDERTLQRLADHAAIAIRNARLHAVAVGRAQKLSMLNIVTRTLTTELDPHDVTRGLLEAVQILIPGAACRLLEQVEGMETLRVVASIGLCEPANVDWSAPHLGAGLAGIAAATREPVVCEDVATDPRFVNRAWAVSEGLVSGVILPLISRDRVIGILSVFLRRRHIFTDEEVNLLRAFAGEGAIALENARLFDQVRAGREQLLDLTQRLVSAQEEERHRLSRELHDEAGQALTALRISLGLIREDLPQEADVLRQRLGETVSLTESVFDLVRRLVQVLRPPALDALGLNAALEGLCRDFSRRTRLTIDYAGTDLLRLPEGVAIHLYRVVQEALTNVSKHARAQRVRVGMEAVDGRIRLTVEDDGIGFDANLQPGAASRTGMGLIGMRERLDLLRGRLDIWSQPGRGTRLAAQVPFRGAS
jgi:signal transduction histidine kinase